MDAEQIKSKLFSLGNHAPKKCNRDSILIVDDEAEIVTMFSFILRDSFPSHKVETAVNGGEAVEKFLTNQHAVIIMDVRMPVMNGLDAFLEIEKLCKKKNWEVPATIFCTGFLPPKGIEEVEGFGTLHSLASKPITGDELTALVKEKLEAMGQ